MNTLENIKLRKFLPENQIAVQELINQGLGDHWGIIDPSKNPDLRDIGSTYEDGDFIVAWLGDQVVGTGALINSSNKTAEIVRMSVAKEFRRQGIGYKILDYLVNIAREKGYRRIILETTETWMDVIEFYRTYGFQITHFSNGDAYFEYCIDKIFKK